MSESNRVFAMTLESMEAFVAFEKEKGASVNMIRRLRAAVRMLYHYLPADKQISREVLCAWRDAMHEKGYAHQTVQNYVKWINLYLDFAGLVEMRFNCGRGKDISGMEFGYITAIEPTLKRHRKDVVWLCRCRCGTVLELPATRLILHNTLSCGCISKETIKRANKYFGGTSIEASMRDTVVSKRSASGYVGVTRKRGKWQAYITYKRKYISLGSYDKLEDAVKARARGKEAVMEDAARLLAIYDEVHKNDEALPHKATEPHREVAHEPPVIHDQPASAARRTDNTSGETGISFRKNKWEARICYHKIRYMLGRFDSREEASKARQAAEALLRQNPQAFVAYYSEHCRQYNA